jgi:hypothetical protein
MPPQVLGAALTRIESKPENSATDVTSKRMVGSDSVNSDSWDDFVTHCACELIAGRMTTKCLRPFVKNVRLRSLAEEMDFRHSLLLVCEELAPRMVHQGPLKLEIDALDNRFQQLLRQHSIDSEELSLQER